MRGVTLALLVAAVCLAGAVAETAVADGPRRPPRGSSEGKAERKSVASVIAARFRELRENAKETFGEIFGKEPVWDNTFEFEIPERFRALSLDTFARWFNGALPGERDADAERHLGRRGPHGAGDHDPDAGERGRGSRGASRHRADPGQVRLLREVPGLPGEGV
jgi:hypothetical protein